MKGTKNKFIANNKAVYISSPTSCGSRKDALKKYLKLYLRAFMLQKKLSS